MRGGVIGVVVCVVALAVQAEPARTRSVDADAAAVADALRPAAGRARVVHLWATWCQSCVAELPMLTHALKRAHADVVFLSLDDADGAAAAARALTLVAAPGRRLRAATPGALAPLHKLDPEWNGSLPTTYVISPDGHVLVSQRGGTDLDGLVAAIDHRTKGEP